MFYHIDSGDNVIKVFKAVIYEFSQEARLFAPDKHYQPSLINVAKARSLL